jgi:hypothetical protein
MTRALRLLEVAQREEILTERVHKHLLGRFIGASRRDDSRQLVDSGLDPVVLDRFVAGCEGQGLNHAPRLEPLAASRVRGDGHRSPRRGSQAYAETVSGLLFCDGRVTGVARLCRGLLLRYSVCGSTARHLRAENLAPLLSLSCAMRPTKIQPPITAREQLEHDLLKRSQRRVQGAPLRRTFVQGGTPTRPAAGPLAQFTHSGAHRALDAYLLLVALATGAPYDVGRDSGVWVRLLGLGQGANDAATMTKTWRWLGDHGLIERGRRGRQSAPKLLCEDGSGKPYTPPTGHGDPYFRVPFAFWLDDTRDQPPYLLLSLAAKAMLVIALSRSNRTFPLKAVRVPDWYGISEDVAGRGLRELCDHNFLVVNKVHVKDLNSGTGWRTDPMYTRLWPPKAKAA